MYADVHRFPTRWVQDYRNHRALLECFWNHVNEEESLVFGLNFDPAEVVAFAPENRFTEFSYATEHVGNDAAIDALLSCRAGLL